MPKRNFALTDHEIQKRAAEAMQIIYEHEGTYQAIAERVGKELDMEPFSREAVRQWMLGKIAPMRAVQIARTYRHLGIKFSDLRPDFAGVE